MKIIIGATLRVEKPTPEVEEWCKKRLTINNPEYDKRFRNHLWLGDTPEKLRLYERDGDNLILPYGTLRDILTFCRNCDSTSMDMPMPKLVWYDCDVPLYDYQKQAVAEALEAQFGIIQAPAGCGKTQMGIALAVTLGRRTLWLTHTHDLLEQSKERAERYMDPSLTGTITAGQVRIGSGITFATVQTMCRLDLSRYRDMWDTIIVDECHRVAGSPTAVTQFSKVLNSLAARHKYGLSATVHRADGMIVATFALLGNIVTTVSEEAVADKIMHVNIMPRPTHINPSYDYCDTDGTLIYTKLISWLSENVQRNAMIVNDLRLNHDHSNLILSDRLDQLKRLMACLPAALTVFIDGKTAKDVRAKALDDMRSGKKRYLFASYSLAKEGLDVPRLDRLFLVTPQKDYAIVTQSVGRIARAFDGKDEPIVYDYVDEKIQYLYRAYKRRCTTYNKLGCRYLEV